jgi:hypothetical protein
MDIESDFQTLPMEARNLPRPLCVPVRAKQLRLKLLSGAETA